MTGRPGTRSARRHCPVPGSGRRRSADGELRSGVGGLRDGERCPFRPCPRPPGRPTTGASNQAAATRRTPAWSWLHARHSRGKQRPERLGHVRAAAVSHDAWEIRNRSRKATVFLPSDLNANRLKLHHGERRWPGCSRAQSRRAAQAPHINLITMTVAQSCRESASGKHIPLVPHVPERD